MKDEYSQNIVLNKSKKKKTKSKWVLVYAQNKPLKY